MRKTFAAVLLTVFAGISLYAEKINVPVLWQRKNLIKDYKYQITGAGMYSDDLKYVWAVRYSNLQELLKHDNFTMGLYMDVDNNIKTGRFPGKAGWDFQINVNIGKKSLSVNTWNSENKATGIPLYIDDYLVETSGDIVYVAVRREAMQRVVFCNKPGFRVLTSAVKAKIAGIDVRFDLSKKYGTFQPPLDFIRFGGGKQSWKKTSEAILIPRKDGYKVWNTFGERYEESEKMPAVVGQENALKSSAARGESECSFFAVTAERPLNTLEVIPSELKSASGAVIPVSQMNVKYIGFAGTLREEYFTDILSPVFMKSRSLNNFVAFRINTPRRISAGIYKGKLRLKINGKEAEAIPVEHEVYNFDMPDRPYFKTAYCIKSGYIKAHFKNPAAKEVNLEFEALNRLSKEYRFSPRLLLSRRPVKWNGNTPVIDWTVYDKAINKYFNEDRFTAHQDSFFQLGSHNRPSPSAVKAFKIHTPDFEARVGAAAREVYEHYKKLGILDKTLFVFWDEPYSEVYPYIKKAIASAKKNAPGLQAGVFIAHLEPELAKYVDIWMTFLATVAKLRLNPATANQKAWAYNEIGMGQFNHAASVLRMYYLLAYQYRIDGYLYSEINVYHDYSGMKRTDIAYNKWVNHTWFYPGAKPGMAMPSLRMELSRDGLDDYDYIMIWKKLSKSEKLPPYLNAVMPVMSKEGNITFKVKTNRELQKIREKLARDIVRLHR